MDWFSDVLRGFSDKQLNEASIMTLANFLKSKGIIDFDEFSEYYENNLSEILTLIVKRDKKHNEELMSQYKNKNEDNVDKNEH